MTGVMFYDKEYSCLNNNYHHFKSFLLWSQDLKVNLCGLQQDIRSDSVK